ncbi:acid tolerance protein [Labrys miyagiensis]|uniref:Acid tolerance protein n=1 Tax=Labrys miyagiensis TaxID=346912 RepID=A0ABQ6CS78_9HYPH|nr:AcvB/VirJ family lysyl-phosphatidylglycerol hydrolase [Labrys miyagiensis]GLS21820.1 acid tolerance protein [Labrys miyagiensis]
MRRIALFCVAMLACTTSALAAPRQVQVQEEILGKVTVLAPEDEPTKFIALLSDKDGFSPAYNDVAEKLVAQGSAVMLIDSQAFIDGLAKGDEEDCHYAFGDIEDASREAQRQLGMQTWRWPVVMGLGKLGGTYAYINLAQAPENTAAGAVSTDFSDEMASKLRMCDGPSSDKAADGNWKYKPLEEMPGRWTLVTSSPPDATEQAFIAGTKGATSVVTADGTDAVNDAAVKAAVEMGAPPNQELSDLPLVELPASGPPVGLAIFISGDGGWRDIDKTIGEILQKEGVAVVGVDSLRYFWSTKEPDVIAGDLTRIISYYTKLWGAKRIAIIGYSLGADVIPFTWQKLSPQTQKKVNLLAMLGLEPTADFEISVSGWLGVASSSDVDLKPYLPGLPFEKTMCFYGAEEVPDNDTACVFPEMKKAEIIERPGGHHFDGNYEPVARAILDRLKK